MGYLSRLFISVISSPCTRYLRANRTCLACSCMPVDGQVSAAQQFLVAHVTEFAVLSRSDAKVQAVDRGGTHTNGMGPARGRVTGQSTRLSSLKHILTLML